MFIKQKQKTKIIILISVGIILCETLQYICATWNDEKSLKQGYYLTVWERDFFVIDYRKCRFSTESNTVLHEPVTSLEFSSEYILASTRAGDNWVIDKTITPVFSYDSLANKILCSTLWGPMDSVSLLHFRDSVHFNSKPKNRWSKGIK